MDKICESRNQMAEKISSISFHRSKIFTLHFVFFIQHFLHEQNASTAGCFCFSNEGTDECPSFVAHTKIVDAVGSLTFYLPTHIIRWIYNSKIRKSKFNIISPKYF